MIINVLNFYKYMFIFILHKIGSVIGQKFSGDFFLMAV